MSAINIALTSADSTVPARNDPSAEGEDQSGVSALASQMSTLGNAAPHTASGVSRWHHAPRFTCA